MHSIMEICTKCGFEAKNKIGLVAHNVKHSPKRLAAMRKRMKGNKNRVGNKGRSPKPIVINGSWAASTAQGRFTQDGLTLNDAIKHLEFEQELIGTMIKKLRSLSEVQ